MSLEDPFFLVKDEVVKALMKTRSLHHRWIAGEQGKEMRSSSTDEREWGTTTELRNALRSIEWDLEDLEDTVQIVEKNPAKFSIDPAELAVRKSFIAKVKDEVRQMKNLAFPSGGDGGTLDSEQEALLSAPAPTATAVVASSSRSYSRVPMISSDAEDDSSPSHIPSSSSTSHLLLQQQKHLVRQQDQQLGIMSESVGNIRDMSRRIGGELDEQAVMLDEFGTEIENAESKLDATMRKMAKVLHMSNDRRQWMVIGILSSATLLLLIIIFAL